REGTDCTIVARSMTVPIALQAAEKMQAEFDVSVEVVDPRTIKPLDIETIVNSVKKTNRLVIAEESHSFASVGAEIAYQIMDGAFDHLDAPIKRISTVEAPMPYAKNLETLALPDVDKIVAAVKEVCYLYLPALRMMKKVILYLIGIIALLVIGFLCIGIFVPAVEYTITVEINKPRD